MSDYKWTVGDPGSARELMTYLAQVTKTTTDLIADLGGFSTERSSRAAKDVYEQIKLGRSAYDITTQDAQKAVVNVLLDAASDVNPLARAAKSIKDLADNTATMINAPAEMNEAREEFRRQLTNGEPDDGSRYYHHWLAALERLITEKGLTSRDAMHDRKEAWAEAYRHTPHGKPVELAAGVSAHDHDHS